MGYGSGCDVCDGVQEPDFHAAIYVRRQMMLFAMKSVRHNAPKDLEEIDIWLSRVQDSKYESQLSADDDSRLLKLESQGNQNCYNYLYRMKLQMPPIPLSSLVL